MKEKLIKLKSDIQKAIDKLDKDGIYGPIGYLEDCLDNIDLALEEVETYFENSEE